MVSYNILDGGTGRVDMLGEVISAQKPEVVVLVEADEPAIVEKIAGRLEMDFICGEGRRHGGAILAKGRILESINHSLLRNEFTDLCLEATVETAGEMWNLAAVHLHPRAKFEDEAIREREIDAILEIFAPARVAQKPHLLAGDFNANSPIQQIVPAKCKEKTRKEIEQNGGVLPRSAVSKILAAGYIDTFHSVVGPVAGTVGSFTTQHPGQRVDYIFSYAVDQGRLKSATVVQLSPAGEASDHFPVTLEIA